MTIYLAYFILILVVPAICSSAYQNRQKAQTMALRVLMVLMYLILALKAETVGCDTAGYKSIYENTKTIPFNDFSYSYMEKGYLLLMKVFNLMGFSFQAFSAFIYALILLPIYHLIKKYSTDVMISMSVLFCLNYFVFICSGLRQALAMSICVSSFLLLIKNKKWKYFFWALLIVVMASYIHRSALLFGVVLVVIFFQNRFLTYTSFFIVLLTLLVNRGILIELNDAYELSHYTYDEHLTLGLMFVFDVIMFVFYIISVRLNLNHFANKDMIWQLGMVIFYGLVLMIGFNGSILMRSSSYELLFLSIIMPMAIESWTKETKTIIRVVYVLVLFYCLYELVLLSNALRIVPYKFFFE